MSSLQYIVTSLDLETIPPLLTNFDAIIDATALELSTNITPPKAPSLLSLKLELISTKLSPAESS